MTATLDVSYRAPTFADSFVVIKVQVVEQKGRKIRVQGRVESLEGQLLVEADALFVEPKMAKFLSSSSVKEALNVGN